MTTKKTQSHNWQVIAYQRSPFKEYHYCQHCNKYKDDAGNIYTRRQFTRIAQLHRLFQPNSNTRLTLKSVV